WPFLGFGVSLWAETGDNPIKLKRHFNDWYKEEIQAKPDSSNSITMLRLDLPLRGAQARRPVWINESKILFHASAYNETAGFYVYDLDDESTEKIKKTSTIEDFVYTYNPNSSTLLYATYHPHPIHDNRYTSRIHQFSMVSDTELVIENSERMFAPV